MSRLLYLTVAFALSCSATMAASISTENKIALQAVMQQEIEKSTFDGVIPHVDLATGQVTELVPTKAHSMILAIGDDFVLCTDFRDPEGKFVNVDYYMTSHGGKYVVFQTEIDNRKPLKKLIASGKASVLK